MFDREPMWIGFLNVLELVAWGAGMTGFVLSVAIGKFLLAGVLAAVVVGMVLRLRRIKQRNGTRRAAGK